MKRNRLAGIGLAGLLSGVAMVATLNVGCGTAPEKAGTSSEAVNGCSEGADCNFAPGTLGMCHTSLTDPNSPVFVCNTATGKYQYECIENGACRTPGDICVDSYASPPVTRLCDSAGRLIGVSTADSGSSDTMSSDSDTGTPDTGTADTAVTDTGTTDTGTSDTGTADTADTAVTDTSVADTAVADTSVADTAVTDTGTTDTGTSDTGTADTAVTDTSVADTAVTDTGVSIYTGLACPSSTPTTVGCSQDYGCINVLSGGFCSTGGVTLSCQCADATGRGWLLPSGADCAKVPVCTFSDAGADTGTDTSAADSTSVDSALADSAVTDSSVADSTVADSSVADTLVSDTASADTSVADTLVSDATVATCAGNTPGTLTAIISLPASRPAGAIGFDYWIKGPPSGPTIISPWLVMQCLANPSSNTASCQFSPAPATAYTPGLTLPSGTKIYFANGAGSAIDPSTGSPDFASWFVRPYASTIIVCNGTTQVGGRVGSTYTAGGWLTASDDAKSVQNDMITVP